MLRKILYTTSALFVTAPLIAFSAESLKQTTASVPCTKVETVSASTENPKLDQNTASGSYKNFIESADGKYSAKIGGFVEGQHGVLNQNEKFDLSKISDSASGKKSKNHNIAINGKLTVDLNAKHDSNVDYGILLEIAANTSPACNGRTDVADKIALYLNNKKFGRLEVGSYDGAHRLISVAPHNYLKATGGFDGDYCNWLPQGSNYGADGSFDKAFYTSVNLPSADASKRSNKITYYTPDLKGFSFGISYIPNTSNYGTIWRSNNVADSKIDKKEQFGYKDVIEAGLRYKKQFSNGIVFLASLTGEMGKAPDNVKFKNYNGNKDFTVARHNLSAYQVGAAVEYKGFTVSAAFSDNGKSGGMKSVIDGDAEQIKSYLGDHKPSSSYYSVGVAYDYQKFGASISYYNSKSLGAPVLFDKENDTKTLSSLDKDGKKNEFQIVSVGVEYKIYDNLKVYGEYNNFKYSKKLEVANDSVALNKGHVFLTGIKAKF